MGFEICGILVLWEKGGEEGRNRERKVGQEPWSITHLGSSVHDPPVPRDVCE